MCNNWVLQRVEGKNLFVALTDIYVQITSIRTDFNSPKVSWLEIFFNLKIDPIKQVLANSSKHWFSLVYVCVCSMCVCVFMQKHICLYNESENHQIMFDSATPWAVACHAPLVHGVLQGHHIE